MNIISCGREFSRFVMFIVLNFSCCILARSATFTVTKTADTNDGVCDADCSLREAVAAANIATANDVIQFDPQTFGLSQTIKLMNGSLNLSGDVGSLTINGRSAELLTIDSLAAERHFNIAANAVVTINRITLFGNRGRSLNFGFGGGIEIYFGTLTLNDSTIINNSAQHGGGFANRGGILRINNSTISNNSTSAGGGGILNSNGRVELINSTLSNNLADDSGGGMSNINSATISLTNVTISNNSVTRGSGGGGVFNSSRAEIVEAYNSIIANNTSRVAPDFKGNLISKGYNLISNTNGTTITGIAIGNILDKDPMLGSLSKNGGSTSTHALLPNSPAIDAGDPASNLVTDQRSFTRPKDGNGDGFARVDIGAFEVQIAPTAASVGVSGRVITQSGRGIRNVQITLIDANGNERTAQTTAFGYYRFDDVTAGKTVTLSAKARRYRFNQSSIVRTTNESVTDANFVSEQ